MVDYTASASGSSLYDSSFTRDALGRITQKIETIGGVTDTFTYSYETNGQLTSITKNGTTIETYSYDANGNRTNATVGGVTMNAVYDAQDRLTQYGGTANSYTAAGDLSSKFNSGQK
jgi:YD repeat-containing protein